MPASEPAAIMYEVVRLTQEIDVAARALEGLRRPIFGQVSLVSPRLNPSELGFIRCVSWLYVHYFEVGKIGIGFLVKRFEVYGQDPDNCLSDHPRSIDQLRTYSQHNLDLQKDRNRLILEDCEGWFKSRCYTANPVDERDWSAALVALLTEAEEFLGAIRSVIRSIELDESGAVVVQDWIRRIENDHAPHEYDDLISLAASDMGRVDLDIAKFRARHYESWRKQILMLAPGFDFSIVARQLIEHTLISELTPRMPITGNDVLVNFAVASGPDVGAILSKANALFQSDQTLSQQAILDSLKSEFPSFRPD